MFLCLTGKSLGMSPILLLFAKPLLLVHCHVFCSVYIYIIYTCSSCIAVISFDRRAIMTYYHPLTNVDPENCQCLEQSSLLTSTIGRVHVSWRVYLIALYKKHKKTHKQNHEFHLFLGQTRMFAYLSSHSFSMNTKFPIVFPSFFPSFFSKYLWHRHGICRCSSDLPPVRILAGQRTDGEGPTSREDILQEATLWMWKIVLWTWDKV